MKPSHSSPFNIAALALAGSVAVCQAQGTLAVTVINPSFETAPYGGTPPGWTLATPNQTTFKINSVLDAGAPDGQYVAAGSGGSSGFIYQEVGPIVFGYDYQLTVSVWSPQNMFGAIASYSISLGPPGGTSVVTGSPSLVPGSWTDRTVTLTASQVAAENLVGKQLLVTLTTSPVGGPYASFDNVRLTAIMVPEPATGALALLAGIALLLNKSRKTDVG